MGTDVQALGRCQVGNAPQRARRNRGSSAPLHRQPAPGTQERDGRRAGRRRGSREPGLDTGERRRPAWEGRVPPSRAARV